MTRSGRRAAGDGLTIPADLRFSAIDAPGANAYPIASATFILVYKDMCKAGKSEAIAQRVKNWLDYGQTDGQSVAKELQYGALPAAIHTAAQAKIKGLTCNGKALQ